MKNEKSYYEANKEKIKENNRLYREVNKEKLKEKNRLYKEANKEKINEKARLYQKNKATKKINSEYAKEYAKEYQKKNKDKIQNYQKLYQINNKIKISEARKIWDYNERRINPMFRLKKNIRTSIMNSFSRNGFKKLSHTEQILNCSFEEFKTHLESKFESWMSWDNYALYNGTLNYGWDIDHIIALATAKDEFDIIRLNHYTNLQPLCSYINRCVKKNN